MSAPGSIDRAKRDALALLDKRAYSRAALIRRLRGKGHEPNAADGAADEMERLGLINDDALARDAVERELSRSPAGRPLLKRRLEVRGVAPEASRKAIDDALAQRDPCEDAEAAARSMLARMPAGLDARTKARRLASRLGRRGFDEADALEAVRRVVGEADADLEGD